MDLKDTKGQRIHVDDPRFDAVFRSLRASQGPRADPHAEPRPFFQPIDKFNERLAWS